MTAGVSSARVVSVREISVGARVTAPNRPGSHRNRFSVPIDLPAHRESHRKVQQNLGGVMLGQRFRPRIQRFAQRMGQAGGVECVGQQHRTGMRDRRDPAMFYAGTQRVGEQGRVGHLQGALPPRSI